ncbi:MAG: crotonyl-CoA carboxylase/reductase [Spirochaetales bacterium]|nr:crotonyl-CoA carboxylase/reductase [Spirochaetales bacterium]
MQCEEKVKLYDIGTIPPLGHVPEKMRAWTIREDRYGEPMTAFQEEIVDVPEPNDDEMLVCTMAAGINYNGIWAAKGVPKNLIRDHKVYGDNTQFHICGSELSGIVYKVGKNIQRHKVGDRVVVGGPQWDYDCPVVKAGDDPMYSPSFRIWGYEINYGAFGQFALVREEQIVPKPVHLSWDEAASYIVSGVTSYRMLYHWKENQVKPNDIVLVWGGAGGIGSMAIQIAKHAGALPIAVVSDDSKFEFCISLGAIGCINRKDFDHWGVMPHWDDERKYRKFLAGAIRFRKAIWKIIGEKRNPNIIVEHPGENTLATSAFICQSGGMVVLCGGTTGYNASFDLRPFWYFQKRFQGSHAGTTRDGLAFNALVMNKNISPALTEVFPWKELPHAHQLMAENRHPMGNTAVLVGAASRGEGNNGC